MAVTLYEGDNIFSMRSMQENSVHSVVTDPPYLLASIANRFSSASAKPANVNNNDGSFARLSGGFMGRKWDAPNVDLPPMSAEFGHYLAGLIDGEGCFSVHKKTVNNCETYDCQFSMNLRADDADILHEARRRLGGIGSLANRPGQNGSKPQIRYCISSKSDCQILRAVLTVFPLRAKKARDFEIWCHALDAWVNHEPNSTWEDVSFYRDQLMLVRRFGSLYKPEILFHYRWAREAFRVLKPGGYVFAFSGARTGHWQACAMEQAGFIMHPMHGWAYSTGFPKGHDPKVPGFEGWKHGTQTQKPALEPIYLGQKPYSEKTCAENLRKWGVGAFNIDECRVASPGETISNHSRGAESAISKGKYGDSKAQETHQTEGQLLGRYPSNLILDGSPEVTALFPDSKGQRAAVKGDEPSDVTKDIYGKFGGRVPAPTRGDSGSAARFFHNFPYTEDDYLWWIDAGLIGPDQGDAILYHAKAGKQDRAGSKHPTVKPIGLLEHLIRHVTPKGGIVLDPFAGSGTTAEAAKRMGFNCILMEAEKSYVEFIHTRFDLTQDGEEGIYSSADKARQRVQQGGTEHEDVIDFDASDPAARRVLVYDLIDLLDDTPFERADTPRGYETVEAGRSVSDTDLRGLLCINSLI